MTNFDQNINRLGTYCSQWDFVKDRFGQEGLLPFTISDMDLQTAPEVLAALKKRVDHGIFGYTRWNHSDYKNAIVFWYQKRFHYTVNPDWIVYSPNVIYALVRFLELRNPNRESVCFITPCYDGFIKILKANHFPMNPVHQSYIDGEYRLDWAELEQKISQSKVFLLCNPNNPNGYLWTQNDLQKIVEICKKYQVSIISDDIHMDFVYKPSQFVPVALVAEQYDYLDNIIIITSSSKTFNLSSLGGAYVICPNSKILAEYQTILTDADSLSSAMVLHVSSLIAGYTESGAWVDELTVYLENNLCFVKEYLEQNIPILSANIPKATYFSWIDCSKLGIPMTEIQEKLINIGKVAIMDGDRYQETMPFLRMDIACPRSKVEEGLKRVELSLK